MNSRAIDSRVCDVTLIHLVCTCITPERLYFQLSLPPSETRKMFFIALITAALVHSMLLLSIPLSSRPSFETETEVRVGIGIAD
jgi:hypothetical protein